MALASGEPAPELSLAALDMTGPDAVVRWSHQEPTIDRVRGANLMFDALGA